MSGYGGDSQEKQNNTFGNEYVNFDQFLMQHNFGGTSSQYYNNAPVAINYAYTMPYSNSPSNGALDATSNAYTPYSGFYPPPMPSNFEFSPNLVQNSNLMATASEFVPYFAPVSPAMPAPGTSPLMASALEFIPRSSTFNETAPTEVIPSPSEGRAAKDRQKETAPKDRQKGPSPQDALMNALRKVPSPQNALMSALRKTQIEEPLPTDTLTSAGGAIKKVKNGNPREGNQRNHNNNNNNNNNNYNSFSSHPNGGQGRHQSFENGIGRNESNERKRDVRKADNGSRRYGTGRTASQYDNSDRYNSPNEYFSDKYKDRQWNGNQNGSAGGSHEHQNGQKSATPSKQGKDKKHTETTAKKIDEFKSNRGNKGPAKGPKMDATNCSQREKLIREIDSGRLECLVCCEMIKPFQSIWSCTNCYHIIHLKCVIQWAASSKSEEGWRCCACQNITKKVPHEYYCFCGKLKNPQYNRSDVAHSCGDCCGKSDACVHPCTQLCHPGPCPPCQATVTRKCGCGRSEKMMQCCQKDDLECDVQCDKRLNCEAHRCGRKCHGGTCDDCDKEIVHMCHCGREQKSLPCTKENNASSEYSCAKVCDKQLKCGNHRCQRLCHADECDDCKLMPATVKTCPCGKMTLTEGQRTSCTDAIPLCTGNCRKPLTCGQPAHPHVCQAKCHDGPCPPCNKQTSVKCRCGNMDQMMKCIDLSTRADDARCKKRCTKKRSCGKHKCNQECCIDFDHVCPMPCTYSLSCGKHKCDQTCHKGRCLPCYRTSFDELHCECGANVIYPPVPCGTKRPACDKPCSRSHPCDHPVTHNCHSAQNCPPCMAFTTKWCHGKHEQRKIIPCSQNDFSCGLPCNKPLKCRQHKCKKPCHDGPCETDAEVCKQSCTKKSRVMCPHKCNAPCHLDATCPDTACREMVEVLCQCGLRKQMRTCQDFSSDYRKIATSKLASSMEQMQSGGMVELSDVLGPVKMTNNKTLECTEECRVHERNRRLAIGLQIRNPDLPSKLQPKYSEFIRGWAKKDAKLVNMIHDKLTELVKLAKESRQKSRSYSFPIMNREKRQLVHEMCAMFGVESVAYDAEPNRNIVATAQRDTSWLPGMSIMETIQRESGQRRIPVPSLNAWGIKR